MEQRNTLSWCYKVKNVTSLVNLCQIRFTSMWKRPPFSLGAEEPTSWVKLRPNACLFLVLLFYLTSQQTQLGACAEDPSVSSTPDWSIENNQGFTCLFSQWGLKAGSQATWHNYHCDEVSLFKVCRCNFHSICRMCRSSYNVPEDKAQVWKLQHGTEHLI